MNFKSAYILILLLFFGDFNCQKYDSVSVKEVEKYLISNPEKAYKLGVKIYEENSLDDKFRVRLLFSLLNATNQTQRFSEAIHYGTEGLDLAEQSNSKVLQIKFLGILGSIYQSLQVNDKAKFYLSKAEDILKKSRLPNSEQNTKGNILYLKGMNYAYTLDCDMALGYFDQAIAAYRLGKDPLSQMNLKLAYINKAYCLIAMNNLKDAEHFLILSKVNRSEIHAPANVPKMYSDVLNQFAALGFARVLAHRNNFNRSNEILLSILELKDQSNNSDIDTDVFLQLSKNFLKMKDIEKGRYYDDLYQRKMAEKNKIQIEILNNLLVQNKKDTDQEIQQQNNQIMKVSFILILFFTTLSLVLAHKIKKIKKANDFIREFLYASGN